MLESVLLGMWPGAVGNDVHACSSLEAKVEAWSGRSSEGSGRSLNKGHIFVSRSLSAGRFGVSGALGSCRLSLCKSVYRHPDST